MGDVVIGKGKLAGKGVYAARDFKVGEIVMSFNLKRLTQAEFDALPKTEHMFVHSFWGKMYLFPKPAHYINHSPHPNTISDWDKMCEYATRPIKKGELITTNATLEIHFELESFVEALEKGKKISDFQWLKGGYQNAVVSYTVFSQKEPKILTLKRVDGNWRIL